MDVQHSYFYWSLTIRECFLSYCLCLVILFHQVMFFLSLYYHLCHIFHCIPYPCQCHVLQAINASHFLLVLSCPFIFVMLSCLTFDFHVTLLSLISFSKSLCTMYVGTTYLLGHRAIFKSP